MKPQLAIALTALVLLGACDGEQGPSGLSGVDGVAGTDGTVGPQGPGGPQGPAGDSGEGGLTLRAWEGATDGSVEFVVPIEAPEAAIVFVDRLYEFSTVARGWAPETGYIVNPAMGRVVLFSPTGTYRVRVLTP